jgi:hypothetical protein
VNYRPWAPQPGPQWDAIDAAWCDDLLFGGARGGGKSDFLIGDYLTDATEYGEEWRGILFRKTYPELEELIGRSQQIIPATFPGSEWKDSNKTWLLPTGATLRMRYLERDADAARYQGHQYTWIGFDEAGNWASVVPLKMLIACLRNGNRPVARKRIRLSANPGGPGHQWVKARYIDPAPSGYVPMRDPETGMSRMFIPSRVTDNRILMANDPNYVNRLRGVGSPELVKAWLDGDWNVISGAFFECWSTDRHVVRPFEIPPEWMRFRSADWGSAKPFSVGWWAVVGDRFKTPDGVWLPRGCLVRYREWYGCVDGQPNTGLKMTAEQVGAGILERERNDPVQPGASGPMSYGVIDPAAFTEDGGPSLAERIYRGADKKVMFRRADNARVAQRGAMGGWDAMRHRLMGDEDGLPMIVCFNTCKDSIRTIPALQHDADRPEDLDTDGEDHAADEWRYACMSRPWVRKAHETPERKTISIGTPSNVSLNDLWNARPSGRGKRI